MGAILGCLILNASAQPLIRSSAERSPEEAASQSTESLQCLANGAGPELKRKSAASGRPSGDRSCFIDLARVRELMKLPSLVAIDLRNRDDFSRGHLPESMNLQGADIKTKKFLSNRALLIYGSGKSDSFLPELCLELKREGFRNVGVLLGGYALLAKAGLIPAFDASNLLGLVELSPAELFSELSSVESLIINVSDKFKAKGLDARQQRFAPPLDEERLIQFLDRVFRTTPKTTIKRIVLVGTNELETANILKLVLSNKIDLPVFVYSGDAATYEQSIRGLDLLWSKKDKGPAAKKCGIS